MRIRRPIFRNPYKRSRPAKAHPLPTIHVSYDLLPHSQSNLMLYLVSITIGSLSTDKLSYKTS
ncbi:Uncharacterised protein [Porphyromonas crevioricanis]|uniref:Uncharacterized protein n=1 Tax=Porphyromonas crevioricanis TaxID=393921 RepID=A0A2X4PIQ3_9PORP|nr:hypothetical protein SAMN02745203_00953 [Porphyromonas crevioricanis]SQH72560.1 Uncharacterised protein [Porphyromonas crevioricanis]